jgi:hypothetical protein
MMRYDRYVSKKQVAGMLHARTPKEIQPTYRSWLLNAHKELVDLRLTKGTSHRNHRPTDCAHDHELRTYVEALARGM